MGVVNCSGKESSYGLCRARLVGSESPGYTQTRFDSLNELRFCVKFRAAVLQMGGRDFYAKYCNTMDYCLEVHSLSLPLESRRNWRSTVRSVIVKFA